MARANRPPRSENPWRRIGIVALAVLSVATVALVWAAANRGAPVDEDVTADPIPEFTPTDATPEPPLELPPQSRLITAAGGDVAWRTTSLECEEGRIGAIEVSADRGATWATYPLTEANASSVLAIEPIDGDEIVGVLARSATDCAPGYHLSFTGGQFWRPEPGQPDVAYAVAGESAIVSGAARIEIGCATPSDFAVRSSNEAAVICDDASLRTTADAAVTWQTAELDASVLAVTTIDRGYLLAEVRHDECDGIRIAVLRSSDLGVEPLACLAAFDESAPVALAVDGRRVWAWIADQVAVSDDGGVTWPATWTAAPETLATPEPTPTEG